MGNTGAVLSSLFFNRIGSGGGEGVVIRHKRFFPDAAPVITPRAAPLMEPGIGLCLGAATMGSNSMGRHR